MWVGLFRHLTTYIFGLPFKTINEIYLYENSGVEKGVWVPHKIIKYTVECVCVNINSNYAEEFENI